MDSHRELQVAAGYVLDQIRVGRRFFDHLDALLIVAITQANVAGVLRDPALQSLYAAYSDPPPEALRRAISVNALATSLRLPFETVRRRTVRLCKLGVVRVNGAGLWTPVTQLATPLHRWILEAAYARLQALHDQAWPDGGHDAPPRPPPLRDGWPLRAAARLSGEYLLRCVERLTGRVGDPLDAAVWLALLRAPVSDAGVSDVGVAAPKRVVAVAKDLGIPIETARRRATGLVARGAAEWAPGGLRVSQAMLASPGFQDLAAGHAADLRRMFIGLAQLKTPLASPVQPAAA